jgi:hypothetical protein
LTSDPSDINRDGKVDIVTARGNFSTPCSISPSAYSLATKPVIGAQQSELLWLENTGDVNHWPEVISKSHPNCSFVHVSSPPPQHLIYSNGPDIFFIVEDLDNDGVSHLKTIH